MDRGSWNFARKCNKSWNKKSCKILIAWKHRCCLVKIHRGGALQQCKRSMWLLSFFLSVFFYLLFPIHTKISKHHLKNIHKYTHRHAHFLSHAHNVWRNSSHGISDRIEQIIWKWNCRMCFNVTFIADGEIE